MYCICPVRAVQDKELTLWLVKAALRASATDKRTLYTRTQTTRPVAVQTCHGVESGGVVVLLTRRTGVRLQRMYSSRVTVDSRFDTTTAEAEGMPPWTKKYLTDVF